MKPVFCLLSLKKVLQDTQGCLHFREKCPCHKNVQSAYGTQWGLGLGHYPGLVHELVRCPVRKEESTRCRAALFRLDRKELLWSDCAG